MNCWPNGPLLPHLPPSPPPWLFGLDSLRFLTGHRALGREALRPQTACKCEDVCEAQRDEEGKLCSPGLKCWGVFFLVFFAAFALHGPK